jgi:hypothetical protein
VASIMSTLWEIASWSNESESETTVTEPAVVEVQRVRKRVDLTTCSYQVFLIPTRKEEKEEHEGERVA